MENLVPLGTGNSRLMKSNIPASTTLAQLIQMLNNGTFPYDIGPLNSAGISQQGTPLNKATLFSDQTMAKYPSGIEDPNDAFEKLANATLYQAYKQSITDINGNTLLTLPATQIYTGSYTGTGTYGSSNPNTLTFPFEPKLVIVTGRTNTTSDYQSMGIFVQGAQWTFGAGAGTALNTTVSRGNNGANQITWNGNTISWYTLCTATTANYRPAAQLNSSGRTYYYIAIG